MDEGTFTVHGVRAVAETDKALRVETLSEDVWVPRSQIMEGSEVSEVGDEGDLTVTRWFAKQRRWVK